MPWCSANSSWGPWRNADEFTPCFEKTVLNGAIPIAVNVLSILLFACRRIKTKGDYAKLHEEDDPLQSRETVQEEEDDRGDTVPEIHGNGISRPWNLLFPLMVSLIQLAIYAYLAWKVVDLNNLLVYSIVVPLVGFFSWMYSSALILRRLSQPLKSGQETHAHLTLIHTVIAISSIIQLRSALLDHFRRTEDNYEELALQIFMTVLSISVAWIFLMKKRKGTITVSKEGKQLSHEVNASIFQLIYFNWFDELIHLGSKKTLDPIDLWDLLPKDRAGYISGVFEKVTGSSLTRRIVYTLRWNLLYQGTFGILWAILSFSGPFFLKHILTYIQDPSTGTLSLAYAYAFGLLFGGVLSSLVFGQALWMGRKMDIRVKAMIMSSVYRKALRRRDVTLTSKVSSESKDNTMEDKKKDAISDESSASTGKIVNLMAVDSSKVSFLVAYVYDVWTAPLRVSLASALLYSLLGWSFAAGLGSQIVLQPVMTYVMKAFRSHQQDVLKQTDRRITRITEVLGAVKILKFFAWEEKFESQIGEIRDCELKALRRRLGSLVLFNALSALIPLFTTIITLATYTMIAKEELTPTIAFTSIALFFQLRNAIGTIPSIISMILQASVSLRRVEKFLGEEETQKYSTLSDQASDENILIGFKDATFSWFSSDDDGGKDIETIDGSESEVDPGSLQQGPFTLRHLNIEFPVGELSLISGPTGSGKTSLLMALLGEMNCTLGYRYLPNGSTIDLETGLYDGVAYVAQTTWLQNATIRENILFGSPFDGERYRKVVEQCALARDLQILEAGDLTEVGEKGIALSGGQKQRLALARAVYSRAKTILLDDCLSAVDTSTGKHILEKCFMGDLMRKRTRILVTHHVGLCLKAASHMVVLNRGNVVASGDVSSVLRTGAVPEEFLHEHNEADTTADDQQGKTVEEILLAEEDTSTVVTDATSETEDARKAKGKLVQTEGRAQGSVDRRVYATYLREAGSVRFVVGVVFCITLSQAVTVYQDFWIKIWSASYGSQDETDTASTNAYSAFSIHDRTAHAQHTIIDSSTDYLSSAFLSIFCSLPNLVNQQASNVTLLSLEEEKESYSAPSTSNTAYYLGVYVVIGIGAVALQILSLMLSFYGSLRASKRLHASLLHAILRAPMRFFDTTPLGRICNRFSKDMDSIDTEVNSTAVTLIVRLLSFVSIVGIIATVTPSFLVGATVIACIYARIGQLYLNASREIKRIESIARSPIFSHFAESIVGVSTIRAYRAEERFSKDNIQRIDNANGPFLWLWGANRWLSIRIDFGGALVSSMSAVLILFNIESMNAGLAGLSLSYALQFNETMLWIVRIYSMNEMSMSSVERVQEYTDLESEALSVIEGHRPPAAWPENGEIEVRDLTLQYSPEHPPVLKNLSFHIQSGERIGIVGRTGAGKSTLAIAFFRILEPISGSIHIDGLDISTIGLADLRSRLTIIPQDPALFTGNLRSNLDPFGQYSDEDLFAALRRVHLLTEAELANAQAPQRTVTSVRSMGNGNPFIDLDNPVSENGTNFSQGQRQLLSLARALLVSRKIIILDEATASVDFETDAKLQTTIREEFVNSGSTILTIAHRLRTIIDYDRILVMDAGSVAQFDTPYRLITQDGIFKEMCLKSGREYETLIEIARRADSKRTGRNV